MSRPFIDFASLARHAQTTQSFKAGEVIFSAGDVGDVLYIIKAGHVAIQVGNRTVKELGEGEIFGEMALIDSSPRSATVIAETDCEVVPVGEKQFLFMTSEAPYFALSVMRILVERLRSANTAIA